MQITSRWREVNVCILLDLLVSASDELEAEHQRLLRHMRAGYEHEANRALRDPELVRVAFPVLYVVRRTVVHV